MAGEDVLSIIAALSADMRTLSSKMTDLSVTMQTLAYQVSVQHETLSQGGGVAVRLAVMETHMAGLRQRIEDLEEQVADNVKRADEAEAKAKATLWTSLAALATAGAGALGAWVQWLGRH